MRDLDRRDLVRLGLGGLLAGPVVSGFDPLRAMSLAAGMAPPGLIVPKVLLIFLRGGNDGVCTVVPAGDLWYFDPANPTVSVRKAGSSQAFIDPTVALGLKNSTFAKLNPIMGPLAGAGSPDDNGHIAWMHQVGNPEGLRSHFTEMQIIETADVQPEHLLNKEGFVPRLASAASFSTQFPSASVSTLMQRWFQTTTNLQVHLRDVPTFQQKTFSTALASHLAGSPVSTAEQFVDKAGDLLLIANAHVAAATPPFAHDGVKFPWAAGDTLPPYLQPLSGGQAFLRSVEGALYLLQKTDCRVAGVEIGGFDTHQSQQVNQDPLLGYLALAMRSVYDLSIADTVNPLLTVVVSEFGRTAAVNGNNGTDHGVGALWIAMGALVKGGVYNCDSVKWPSLGSQAQLPPTSPFANACDVKNHFLVIYREIIRKLFGISNSAQMTAILPGLLTATGPTMTPLGFLL